jgi:hypothetical protein
MLVIYVDDLLVAAATEEDLEQVLNWMGERFKLRRMGVPQYFLGMDVRYNRNRGQLQLSQRTYIGALMERYGEYAVLPRSMPMQTGVILTKEQGELQPTQKPYSSLVGALLFLAVSTRPDISFAVGILSKFLKCPGEQHWEAAVGVLSYLNGTRERGVVVGNFGFREQGKLIGFADADWANDQDDRKSVSGGALFLGGGIVLWHSRKQQMVCTSTAEAEIHAVLEMVYAVKSVAALVEEIFLQFFGESVSTPVLFSDNQPGLDAISSNRGRTKHYDIKIKFIAERVEQNELVLRKISTSLNVADVFTKAVRAVRFRELARVFMASIVV